MKDLYRLTSIFICLMLIFATSGCSTGEEPPVNTELEETVNTVYEEALEQAKAMETHGNKVTKYEKKNYYTMANVSFGDPITVGDVNSFKSGQYLQISGLKDKELEAEINKKIESKFFEIYEDETLPPYRGVNVKIRDFSGITPEINVFMYQNSKSNNVLSLCISKSWSYRNPSDTEFKYFNVSDDTILSIDLNTGEELTLKDMFLDGFDYVSYLNEKVKEYIADENMQEENMDYWNYDFMKLAGQFETVKANHKFSINEGGQRIGLIFDHNTPEFDTMYMTSYIYIDLEENAAMAQRFASNGKQLYENEQETRYLFMNYNIDEGIADYYEEVVDISEETGIQNAYVNINITQSNNSHQNLIDEMNKLRDSKDEFVEMVIAECNKLTETYPADELEISAVLRGTSGGNGLYQYTDISEHIYVSHVKDGFYQGNVYEYNVGDSNNYDPETGEIITINDIFKDDVDGLKLMKQITYDLLCNSIERFDTDPSYADMFSEEEKALYNIVYENFDALADEVFLHIDNFTMGSSSLNVTWDRNFYYSGNNPMDNMLRPYIEGDERFLYLDEGTLYNVMFQIFDNIYEYSKLGYENLKAFE